MARSIWSGAVSFGLVNVPVKAYAAVRDHTVHFNQLEKGTGARIKYKKVSEKTGKEVASHKIESGYEISPDQYVVFDPDELDDLRPRTTQPASTRPTRAAAGNRPRRRRRRRAERARNP